MKRIFGILLASAAVIVGLQLATTGQTAQAEQKSAAAKAPAASRSVDITVYGNRLAQVQETRTVKLTEGQNHILLDGIATNYRPDSLRVLGAKGPGTFRFRSATYQPPTLTTERILTESVGKDVSVVCDKESIKGKLLSFSGGTLTIDTGSGALRLVSSADISIPQGPTGLSRTAAVVIEADVVLGDIAQGEPTFQLTFSYETTGIGWAAKHNAVYDDAKSQFESWQTVVSVVNNSGADFENATLRLLSAAALGNDAPGGMYKSSLRTASVQQESASDAAVEDVGDQKTYTIPGTVTLVNSQTRQIQLFESKNVPVKREYFVPANPYGYGPEGNTARQTSVSIRLTVENCEKHNLGKPLPAGTVKIYQYNSAGIQQQTGGTQIGDKTQDETFEMVIGTASDIKYTRTLVEQTDNLSKVTAQQVPGRPVSNTPVFEDQTWEVKVYNYKRDRDVEVKVEVTLPSAQDVAPPLTKKSAGYAQGTVTAPKSDSGTLRFKLRIQVR